MPLQNRVTPEGAIVASTARGTMLGNRGGCFHRPDKTLKPRQWATRQWLCCVLSFKNRRRKVFSPGLYTELFFLDEATALAAGHRPCFECRRADATLFAEIWAQLHASESRPSAPQMDAALHTERLRGGLVKRTTPARIETLPDGAFIRWNGAPHLVSKRVLKPWRVDGYAPSVPRPGSGMVDLLTPPTIVAILAAGYAPMLHPTAT